MKSKELKYNMMLLLTAAIWGFAFIAQRVGGKFLGPFTYNGLRFALGSLSLLPVMHFSKKLFKNNEETRESTESAVLPGAIAGAVVFAAASLQQIGLSSTTAGKAAFITGLYLVIVPLMGIFLRQYIGLNSWVGCAAALSGLYFLSVTKGFSVSPGDFYEFIGAFFWAAHILIINHYSRKVDVLKLSFYQFAVCAFLSLAAAAVFENITLSAVTAAAVPVLYGGICSVGVAYTLQAVGQKYAQPAHASILLSMESVFAAIGDFLILHQTLNIREISGCALMLAGMLLTQLPVFKEKT